MGRFTAAIATSCINSDTQTQRYNSRRSQMLSGCTAAALTAGQEECHGSRDNRDQWKTPTFGSSTTLQRTGHDIH